MEWSFRAMSEWQCFWTLLGNITAVLLSHDCNKLVYVIYKFHAISYDCKNMAEKS